MNRGLIEQNKYFLKYWISFILLNFSSHTTFMSRCRIWKLIAENFNSTQGTHILFGALLCFLSGFPSFEESTPLTSTHDNFTQTMSSLSNNFCSVIDFLRVN